MITLDILGRVTRRDLDNIPSRAWRGTWTIAQLLDSDNPLIILLFPAFGAPITSNSIAVADATLPACRIRQGASARMRSRRPPSAGRCAGGPGYPRLRIVFWRSRSPASSRLSDRDQGVSPRQVACGSSPPSSLIASPAGPGTGGLGVDQVRDRSRPGRGRACRSRTRDE